ncbi:uncharacterized protein LOC131664343 [Phymastichus coffea]|uniref:uncharacterized protein LOC131664343 n=1 Tax=Phymastichus coffea TaxID=108790 RepID=UPI00273C90FA|nr:uncharacterized protein LOC131664343 [Phymastichus coffea]XP_058791339.1 uncharacterized protein LOC131664343 [Phymastichus coffea]XP_058791340.1 uncharacterized protein LOC131664343 [Phymastichus coffea]
MLEAGAMEKKKNVKLAASAVDGPASNREGSLELRISAPGKVILFGEHSVVYGKTALAASLKLRSTLILRELPEPADGGCCQIEMPGVGLSIQLPADRLQESLLAPEGEQAARDDSDEEPDHAQLLERARDFTREHVKGAATLDQRQRCSLECALYALTRVAWAEDLCQLPTAGFLLRLTTELPLGAGLGSSASFSVCLVAGFLLWARLRRCGKLMLDSQTLRQVSCHALGCERIMHGTPSGVDNEVCTFGSVIEFRKGEEPILLPLSAGRLAELRVLLVDTRVARSTKLIVDRLARLHVQYPEVFDAIFEAIDRLSRRVIDIVKAPSSEDAQLLEACRQLSALIDVNQGLLTACQTSHPTIDSICAIARRHGLSAKLTGAGGGGFVYALVPPDMPTDKLHSITCELTANGFSVVETSIGGSGLDVAIAYDNH